MFLRCKPRIAVHTRPWEIQTFNFVWICAFPHSESLYVCTLRSTSVPFDPTPPSMLALSRNPSRHGRCRAPTSGPSTSWRTCSRRKRSGVWAAKPASSRPSPWLRRPATSPPAAPRLSRRKKVGQGVPGTRAYILQIILYILMQTFGGNWQTVPW